MTTLPIPHGTDLSLVPSSEEPYLQLDGSTRITNLLGDKIILKGIVLAYEGFANKKFDKFTVLSCPAHVWAFIFQNQGETRQKDLVQDLLVAGYSIEIQREKISVPHTQFQR